MPSKPTKGFHSVADVHKGKERNAAPSRKANPSSSKSSEQPKKAKKGFLAGLFGGPSEPSKPKPNRGPLSENKHLISLPKGPADLADSVPLNDLRKPPKAANGKTADKAAMQVKTKGKRAVKQAAPNVESQYGSVNNVNDPNRPVTRWPAVAAGGPAPPVPQPSEAPPPRPRRPDEPRPPLGLRTDAPGARDGGCRVCHKRAPDANGLCTTCNSLGFVAEPGSSHRASPPPTVERGHGSASAERVRISPDAIHPAVRDLDLRDLMQTSTAAPTRSIQLATSHAYTGMYTHPRDDPRWHKAADVMNAAAAAAAATGSSKQPGKSPPSPNSKAAASSKLPPANGRRLPPADPSHSAGQKRPKHKEGNCFRGHADGSRTSQAHGYVLPPMHAERYGGKKERERRERQREEQEAAAVAPLLPSSSSCSCSSCCHGSPASTSASFAWSAASAANSSSSPSSSSASCTARTPSPAKTSRRVESVWEPDLPPDADAPNAAAEPARRGARSSSVYSRDTRGDLAALAALPGTPAWDDWERGRGWAEELASALGSPAPGSTPAGLAVRAPPVPEVPGLYADCVRGAGRRVHVQGEKREEKEEEEKKKKEKKKKKKETKKKKKTAKGCKKGARDGGG
ncbi:MAG: hypothetical protein LQ340_004358, partial [Diploschistes diacapsis]